MRLLLLLILLVSVHGIAAAYTIQFPPECWHSSLSGRYDPLACWLLHLKVNIPDQSFHSGLVSIDINNLECTNFTVGALLSSYQQPSLLNWNAQNVSAICQGSYQVSGGLIAGQVFAGINSTDHVFDIDIQIASSNATIGNSTVLRPTSVQTTNCQTNIELKELQFTGSISAKIVNLFAKSISSYITEAIQQQVCPLFPTQVDPWLTLQLTKVNEWIDRQLSPSSNASGVQSLEVQKDARELLKHPEAIPSSTLVDLQSDIPFFKNTMDWLNDAVVQPHLQEGLLPHHWLPTKARKHNDSCGFFFNGWNGVVESLVTKSRPDGVTIPLPVHNISVLVPHYAQLELQLHSLSIVSGLEHWENVDLFRIQSSNEISSMLANQNMTIRCDMKMVVQTIPDGIFQGDDLIEYFSIELHADSLSVLLNLQLDYQGQVLQTLTMDTILNLIHGIIMKNETMTQQSLDDLIGGVDRLEVSELMVDVLLSSLVLVPHVNKSGEQHKTLEEDLDGALNNLFQLILHEYPPLVQEIGKAIMNDSAKSALNEFFNRTISNRSEEPVSSTGFAPLELSETDQFNFTQYLVYLNDFFRQPSTITVMNQYVDCIGDFLGDVIDQRWANTSSSAISKLLQLESFVIDSLDSFREMQLLAPESGGRLTTSVEYGSTRDSNGRPRITVAANPFFAPFNITAAVIWETSLDDIFIELASALSYDVSDLRRFSLPHILQYGQCILTPLSVSFDHANTSLGIFQTIIHASLKRPSWNQAIEISFDSKEYPLVQGNVSLVFDWAVASLRDSLASVSSSLLTNAAFTCEGMLPPPNRSDNGDDNNISYSSIFLVIGAVLIFAQPVLLLLKTTPLSREERYFTRQPRPDLEEPLLNDPSIMFDRMENALADSKPAPKSCLMHSTNVPYFFRVFVPILILSTIFLLLSSNLSVGATVDLVLRSGDEVLRIPPLFGFSLVNTAKEMLKAKIYPFSFLCGVWPYCKLFLMLISWATETTFLSVKRRERLLLALDALSKFSLVDTYVLVLFVVAFRYHLDLSPDQNESSVLDVYVTPQYGFYGFLLATALSLIAGHMLVYYHRRVRLSEKHITDSESQTLMDHQYAVEGRRVKLSRKFCFCIAATLTVTLSLLAFGVTRECFHFDFGGLGGIILGDKRRKTYSLLSLGSSLSESVEKRGSSGILFLQAAYYFYAVFTPFATLLFLAAFVVVPLSVRGQLTLITLAEIANAWSAVEVFVLSIVAALLQISTFASFIIGDRCDLIEKILEDQSETQIKSCFSVHASVSWDGAFLLLGVLLNSAWVSVVLHLAHLSLEERLELVTDSESNTLTENEPTGPTIVERLASSHWTCWVVDLEPEYAAVSSDGGEEATNVATASDEDGEWKEPADHDPTWKEWKEAESPAQTPDR